LVGDCTVMCANHVGMHARVKWRKQWPKRRGPRRNPGHQQRRQLEGNATQQGGRWPRSDPAQSAGFSMRSGRPTKHVEAVPKKRTPQQVGKSSKAKGSGYENTVKRIFALWYGESPEVAKSKNSKFQRTPGSGGTSPSNWPLDIHVPSDFPWAIECKNREGLNNGMEAMERFMTVDQYNVVEWFLEAEKELLDARVVKPALLVFTRNKYPDFVAFRRPEKKDEGHMNIEIPHITLCDGVIGELVVTRLAPLLAKYKLGHWQSMYLWADQKSWRPLG